MKIFTKDEFDSLLVVDGIKQCPTGDYSNIKILEGCSFGEGCRFGEWCRFGERCSFGAECSFGAGGRFGKGGSFGAECRFGERCSFEEGRAIPISSNVPYLSIDKAGSVQRKSYFFITKDDVMVRSGCFFGTGKEFSKAVLNDVKETDIKAIQYLGMLKIAEATRKHLIGD